MEGGGELGGVHLARNYIFAGKVNFEGSRNDGGAEGKERRRKEGRTDSRTNGRKEKRDRAGREGEENKEEEEEEEVRNGERKGGEAVIKSDCIASRMSQESRISGDVKPCLTPQLDNCGCGS